MNELREKGMLAEGMILTFEYRGQMHRVKVKKIYWTDTGVNSIMVRKYFDDGRYYPGYYHYNWDEMKGITVS